VGHGVPAAALMGQVRTALHAYAIESHSAARTLELLDRFVLALAGYTMATAAYAVFDPVTGVLQLSSAGHLPPLLIGAEGARVVKIEPGPPLGVAAFGSIAQRELTLAAGEMLVLYTDGLIERPRVPLSDSIELLRRTLCTARSPEAACQTAFEALVPETGGRDDVAMVAIQHQEVPVELHMRLPAAPRTLAEIRRIVRRWLRERSADPRVITDITLAVNEAATNAIEHAYSPSAAQFELHATEQDGQIVIVIRDSGRWSTRRRERRGRGLPMIRAAMDEVDVSASEEGTTVLMRKTLSR
jgi:anti-sigma regulatory factor (Ser/Thr protein kinase)